MSKRSFFHLPVLGHRAAAAVLAGFFLPGLLLGVWCSGFASDLFVSTMRAVVSSRVSIFGLLSSMALPLLVSAFAVYIRQPVLLFPTAFLKAFLFSYPCCGLLLAWGDAGWLVSGLMMLPSICALPVLWWYWLRHIDGKGFDFPSFIAALAVLVTAGILNYCFIVPFLASIITF